MVVILIIAVVIGAAIILWFNSSRGADVNATAVMISQDLVRVNALVDSGTRIKLPSGDWGEKDRYRICFEETGPHANSYEIEKFTYVDGTPGHYVPSPSPYKPEKGTYNRMVEDVWIKPSGSSDIRITPSLGSSGSKYITYISVGSMVRAVPTDNVNIKPEDLAHLPHYINDPIPMTITVTSTAGNLTKTITVSNFGDAKIR